MKRRGLFQKHLDLSVKREPREEKDVATERERERESLW